MLFHSWAFLALLACTLVLYHGPLAARPRERHAILLAASYVFYGWWDVRFLGLMVASSMVDFWAGREIESIRARGGPETRAKAVLAAALSANLGILGFFKYWNFFSESFAALLANFGMHAGWPVLNIVLPVGISFYTFQSMAYSIDVYRRDIAACRDWLLFALYVSFFPQLVAGPIERAGHLMPGLEHPRRMTSPLVQSAVALIIMGFFKKLAISDAVAPKVDAIFGNVQGSNAVQLLAGGWLFTVQLYADFSAYSDIARGTARLFGVELMRNFEQPYLSTSMNEFWRRWHISLMNWFRDYVYIPLGGSRVGPVRAYGNILGVMALSGLWHGANWSCVLWGVFNGAYLCLERAWRVHVRGGKPPAPPRNPAAFALRAFLTFQVFLVGCVIFRNTSAANTAEWFRGVFTRWGAPTPADTSLLAWLGATGAILLAMDIAQRRAGVHEFPMTWRPLWGGIALGAMLAAAIFWSDNPGVPFIYFAF